MVTIADVAVHAGVAPSTVSYVLTGKRTISADTKTRVRESIRQLGYSYHTSTRVTANRANVLALVLPSDPSLSLSTDTRFVTSAVAHARRHGMDVLLVSAGRGERGLRRLAGVDGFLVMDAGADDERLQVLRRLGRPAVLIGQSTQANGFACVDLDFEAAGARCADHLADLGHRYLGFLGAPSGVYQRASGVPQRIMAGFGAAAMRRGLATVAVPTDDDHESVLRTTAALLRAHPAMTALVVQNETAAGWVASCLRAAGRRVPVDVAVVAICPDSLAGQLSPPLTSVHLPCEDLARRAVELLVGLLDGHPAPPLTLLPPRLSERMSTRRV